MCTAQSAAGVVRQGNGAGSWTRRADSGLICQRSRVASRNSSVEIEGSVRPSLDAPFVDVKSSVEASFRGDNDSLGYVLEHRIGRRAV